MSYTQTEWNFPCSQARDISTEVDNRFSHGVVWENTSAVFTEELTCVFSFLIRSGWTAVGSETGGPFQGLHSVGRQSWDNGYLTALAYGGGNKFLRLTAANQASSPGTAIRYQVDVGDDDGVSWLQDDTWYQMAISISQTAYNICVNKSTTFTSTVTTNVPGALNMNSGSPPRMWHLGPSAAWGVSVPTFVGVWYPSVVLGPMAMVTGYVDWSVQANRDRVWDANGQFINPGENGSGWFNDTYTTAGGFDPQIYWPCGVGTIDKGSTGLSWTRRAGGSSGLWSQPPAGFKKQYLTAP